MSYSSGEGPGANIESFRNSTLSDALDSAADSSSFISNPEESTNRQNWVRSPQMPSDGDASDSCNEDNQNNSIILSSKSSSEEFEDDSVQDQDFGVEKLDNFSGLKLVDISETCAKHPSKVTVKPDYSDRSIASNLPLNHDSDSEVQTQNPPSTPTSTKAVVPETPQIVNRFRSQSVVHNSTFIDDTKEEFDLDIEIDDYHLNSKQHQRSPWRNFRSESPRQLPQRQASVFSRRNFSEASSAGVASTEKIEDLSRQLTNCKIQLKLYEKFLQDLIDGQSINGNEVSMFHQNLDSNISTMVNAKPVDSLKEDATPNKESLEVATLLEDLYANLQEYQDKWRSADNKVSNLNSTILDFAREVSTLMDKMGIIFEDIDKSGDNGIPESQLDQVLQQLRRLSSKNTDQVTPSIMLQNANHPCLDDVESHMNLSSTSTPQKSRNNSDRNIELKLQEYQAMIDRLQREVNELKNQSRRESLSDSSEQTFFSNGGRDREKFLLLQKDYEILQGSHHDLIDEHHRYKISSERTISSLKNQADRFQKERFAAQSDLAAASNLQQDLEVSVETQRNITTEKIKLSYQVEALKQDKVSMQKNIDKLSERLVAASEKSGPSFAALRQQANSASDTLDKLFGIDVEEFEKLLRSFNKIADDDSLEDSRKKVNFMISLKGTRILDLSGDTLKSMEEAHKSVSNFFSRAVEIIVNDHIRVLLKENEVKDKHGVSMEELKRQIKALEERNRKLSERPDVMPSPRSKLRIEELTNRWKAEREARILENRQARKRLQEIGQERKSDP